MTPEALLADIEARGIRVIERAGALVASPAGVLQDAEKQVLRAHKAAVVELIRERQAELLASVVRVPLRALTRVLEVAVPWCDVPLLIAPGCRVARELRQADAKPGRVWCVCEVLDLLLTNVSPGDARKVAEAKLLMDGAVAGARREG